MDFRLVLGERIGAARRRQRYSVSAAAKKAGMARDTWTKIEKGRSVHDTNLDAALQLLGLDDSGDPIVGKAGVDAEVDEVEQLRQAILALRPGPERTLLVTTFETLFGFEPTTPPTTPASDPGDSHQIGA